MKQKKNIIVLASMVAIFLIMNQLFFASDASRSETGIEEQGILTELEEVQKKPMVQALAYLGTLESETNAMLSSKISGMITSIYVSEGDIVHEGDVLLEIDSEQIEAKRDTISQKRETLLDSISYLESEIKGYYSSHPMVAKVESARLSLAFQQSEVEKYRRLYAADAVSLSQLEQKELQLQSIKWQVEELEQTLLWQYDNLVQERDVAMGQLGEVDASLEELALSISDARLTAPFAGQVTQMVASLGELASPGKLLVGLDSLQQLSVVTQVGESDLQKIQPGMSAEMVLGGSDVVIVGTVSYKSESVSPKTRIGEVRIEAPIPPDLMMLGSSVRITILLDDSTDEIMIPKAAVKWLDNRQVVYVYDDGGRVQEKEIVIGESVKNEYQVVEGLVVGDMIAIRNIQSLRDGARIYVFDGEETK